MYCTHPFHAPDAVASPLSPSAPDAPMGETRAAAWRNLPDRALVRDLSTDLFVALGAHGLKATEAALDAIVGVVIKHGAGAPSGDAALREAVANFLGLLDTHPVPPGAYGKAIGRLVAAYHAGVPSTDTAT